MKTTNVLYIGLLFLVLFFGPGLAEANTAPTTNGTIPAQMVVIGGDVTTVDVSSYFSDADGDALTYAASSSDTTKATVTVSDADVSITGVAAGTATITVTATDPDGESATQTFSATLNSAPVAVGTIPDQTVDVHGNAATVDASSYFSDPDGDTLSYAFAFSDTSKIDTTVTGSKVTFAGDAAGTVTATVTATDTGNLTATQTFTITVVQPNRPPTAVGTISSQTVSADSGTATVDVSGYFSDPDNDTLTYTSSTLFDFSAPIAIVTVSWSNTTLTITGGAAGTASITVTAADPAGLTATQSFSVTVEAPSTADAIPGFSSEERLALENLLTFDAVIFNELYNDANSADDWLELRNVSAADLSLDAWQLNILTSTGSVAIDFPAGTVIPAGGVLLLVNTEPARTEASISSVVVEAFVLPEQEFGLLLEGPEGLSDLASNTFAAEIGIAWYRIQPTVSGYGAEAWSKSRTQDGLGTPGYRHSSETADLNNDGTVNILDLVLVASQFGTMDTSAADLNNDGVVNIQDLVVVANALGDVAGAPSVQQSQATLVKKWLQLARQNATGVAQSFIPEGFSYERGILVLEQLTRAFVPETTALLANYPNPFNPETWIPYQLSEAADVTVSIYASNGTVVRTLVLGHQDAGVYKNRSQAAYWDGRNDLGETVASGLYFYTLTAGDFTATRPMLILK